MQYTDKYIHLGLWLKEHLEFKYTVSKVAASANRALGGLISKLHKFGGMNYEIFSHRHVYVLINYRFKCMQTVLLLYNALTFLTIETIRCSKKGNEALHITK